MLPQVRDLQATIQEQMKAVAPQQQLIKQSLADQESYATAQMTGLESAKKAAFGNIEQQAQNKGMFFSGVPVNEQAGYVGGTYLPKLAELQMTIAQNRNNLLGKSADLYSSAYDKASNLVEQDRAVLNDWNKMTAQQQFQASQEDKQRVFEAQQNQARINADAANTRAGIAAQKDNALSSAVQGISTLLKSRADSDGYVNPQDFQDGRSAWVAAGGDPEQYTLAFGKYINPKSRQKYDYSSYLDTLE